jgi:hypothetical protein
MRLRAGGGTSAHVAARLITSQAGLEFPVAITRTAGRELSILIPAVLRLLSVS